MNETEERRWEEFMEKHKGKGQFYYEVWPGAIGDTVIAVCKSKFPTRRINEDITDHSSW